MLRRLTAVLLLLAATCSGPAMANPISCADLARPPVDGRGLPGPGEPLGPGPLAGLGSACPSFERLPARPLPLPDCADGQDDDEDGSADFPSDHDCDGPTDGGERPACSDGLDNDGDGSTDHSEDADCGSGDDPFESPCSPQAPMACGGPSPCPAFPLPPMFVETHRERGGIQVTWQPAPLEPTAYLVYRIATGETGPNDLKEPLAGVAGDVVGLFDDTASPKLDYVYWVTSAGAGCQSAPSNMSASVGWVPDTSDCVYPGLRVSPPGADPHVYGTGCLPI